MQNLKKFIFCFCSLAAFISTRAQTPSVIESYIQTYKELAMEEMQRTGVPAAIKLAQGIHETMAGTSDLVLKSNNHFGIKCKANWTGESVSHDDDARGECFRRYSTAEQSYRDHSDFLRSSDRYAFLFNLDPTNYEGWAKGLKKAGYATNPRYPQIIIGLIEEYQLQDYTLIALGRKPVSPEKEIITVAATTQNVKPENAMLITSEPEIKTIRREVPAYPETEFTINETRVIYVKKGTPFMAIAEQYNIPLARIFEFNDLPQSETVSTDQLIFLQRKRKSGNNEFHIVAEGETLYDIAQTEAIRLETLLEFNLLQKNMSPAAGEKLYLRGKAAKAPQLASKKMLTSNDDLIAYNNPGFRESGSLQGNCVICTVQPRETIYSISKRYNVRIDDIVKWNQLGGYELKTGQQLKIYK
jgi:LysM repeat protein